MFFMKDCQPKKKLNSDVDLDSDAEAPDFRAPLNAGRAGGSPQGPPSSAPPLEPPSPRVGGEMCSSGFDLSLLLGGQQIR